MDSTSASPASAPRPESDVWTYRRILDWTQQKLREHGSESPRVEAEVLLAHAAGCQRILLYTRLDQPTPETVRATMRGLVQRRMKSEPVAYLVGHREFFGLDFVVSPDVLVPRPETETLVMAAIDWLEANPQRRSVLEVGVGSGCVAISVAKTIPDANVLGVDVSDAALRVAESNVTKHELHERVRLAHGETYKSVGDATFDLIVSNPPYIREDEMAGLQADVRLHEPIIALVSGSDGLDVAKDLISEGPDRLKPNGHLMLEVDPLQMASLSDLLSRDGWEDVTILNDSHGDQRVISARRPA